MKNQLPTDPAYESVHCCLTYENLDALGKIVLTATANYCVSLQIGDYVFDNFDARWSGGLAPDGPVTA